MSFIEGITNLQPLNLQPLSSINGTKDKSTKVEEEESVSFGSILSEQLDKVNDKQIAASEKTISFIKGDEDDISSVLIAGEEAKMSLNLAVQVRNKLLEAYQEISRIQL